MEVSRGLSGDEKMLSYELTLDQQVQLEVFFERCPHPEETQGDQIAKELGLESTQIKHWFQNKRTKQECDISDPVHDFASSDSEMEAKRIAKVANLAMAELLKLMRINEPLWAKSSYGVPGYVLVRERYASMFPRVDSLNSPPHTTREESSKYCRVVRIRARKLVEMLLDSEEWVNHFPTIVSKSETVKVLDVGSLENRNGALQVVCEKMQAISPLVSSRELFFLRYCQQVTDGTWAIAHVSIDSIEGRVLDSPVRRLPSGCVIYQMNEEFSMVIWAEHVEVNERIATCSRGGFTRDNVAYGAERWLWALNRMCERFVWTSINNMPPQASPEEVKGFNARMRAMRFSNRMVQGFFGVLYKLRDGGLAQSLEENNTEIKISLRKNTTPGMPEGIIATAITCIRLPVPQQNWDVLSGGFAVNEFSHFTMGGRNCISILKEQTYNRIEGDVLMFQDSYIDPMGSYMVYAPISEKNMSMIMNGGDSMVSILPSGFLISEDHSGTVAESSNRPRGSVLTMAYQLLICSNNNTSIQDQNRKTVVRIVVSALQNIKTSLKMSED
ncbi:hypothetical protein JHK85_024618 [Glycine max]|nr:hypothetical protein JHK85_024618 [Glycine max]